MTQGPCKFWLGAENKFCIKRGKYREDFNETYCDEHYNLEKSMQAAMQDGATRELNNK